jgi:hypothetical protein
MQCKMHFETLRKYRLLESQSLGQAFGYIGKTFGDIAPQFSLPLLASKRSLGISNNVKNF